MTDLEEILGWPLPPDPLAPIIPTVEVIREWPYFRDPEDVDREAIESVVDELRSLWERTSNLKTTIDDATFHAPNAAFWYELNGERCDMGLCHGNGQVAIANLRFLGDCWNTELHRPALKKLSINPSPAIIWGLIEDRIDTSGAWSILRNSMHHLKAIASLEKSRQRIVAEVGPMIEVFLKSLELASETNRTPGDDNSGKQRNDTPSASDLQEARNLCSRHTKVTKKLLMDQLAVGNNKALKIMEIMRTEGLIQSKQRTKKN